MKQIIIFLLNIVVICVLADGPVHFFPKLNATIKGEYYWTKFSGKRVERFAFKYGGPLLKHEERFKPAARPNLHPLQEYYVVKCIDTNFNSVWTRGNQGIDCIRVGVGTPSVNGSRPVLVYLPGMDLSRGSLRNHPPAFFLEREIVQVVIQYRIGAMGFLSTETEEIPGNAGVLDVINGLKWVQDYIDEFGGDPKRVTLMGQFKAAGLIHILSMSPLAEGLYHQVALLSGSALLPNLTTTNPLDFSKNMAKRLCKKINVDNITELNSCLINTDLDQFADQYPRVLEDYKGDIPFITVGGLSGIIPDTPENLIAQGKYRSYPTIVGVVDNPSTIYIEALHAIYESYFTLKRFKRDKNELLRLLEEKYHERPPQWIFDLLASKPEHRFTDNDWKRNFDLIIGGILDWSSNFWKRPINKVVEINKDKTYLYAFKYHGQFHYYGRQLGNKMNEVAIEDDGIYLFDVPWLGGVLNDEDKIFAQKYIDLFASFIETGVPTTGEIEWPVATSSKGPYLRIGKNITVGHNFDIEYSVALRKAAKKHFGDENYDVTNITNYAFIKEE